MIRTLQHTVGGSPPNIAVEGDFQRLVDFALNLQLLKVFNAMSRGLNLFKIVSRGS